MKKMAAVLLSVTVAAGAFSVCGVQAAQEERLCPPDCKRRRRCMSMP
ncbi:MAG: hypothetical protein II346_07450 [Ruminococcus sp.]|nr:hypothetical protein [Ruminococcus sp.]